MPKYSPQIESAYRLIRSKGQAMTLYRMKLDPVYDPISPEDSSLIIEAQNTCAGVVLPASNGTIEAFDQRILADPLQLQNFRFVILAGKGLTINPQALDILEAEEGYYRILGATPLNPAGDGAIIYNVGCSLDLSVDIAALLTP